MFAIHFHSLPNTGEGDTFMSPEFQQTLAGSNTHMTGTPIGNDHFPAYRKHTNSYKKRIIINFIWRKKHYDI